MKNINVILITLTFIGCKKSEKEECKELISIRTSKSIFQIVDLKTNEMKLDTIEMNWNGTRLVTIFLNNSNNGGKMVHANISTYNFEKEIVAESFLYYDLNGDSIRYVDTSFYDIGKINTYTIENKSFEVIKEPRSIFNKSRNPNRYTFISKDFGLLATLSYSKKSLLLGFADRKISTYEKQLVQLLNNDPAFFNMNKEN